jgi:hypothetical protein
MLRSLLPRNLGKRLSELYKSEADSNAKGQDPNVFEGSSKKVTERKKATTPSTNKFEMSNKDGENQYENMSPTDKLEEAPKDK